jgi:polyisoprenoid-binding protein YceI
MTRTLLIMALALSASPVLAQEINADPEAATARHEIERLGYRDVRGLAEDERGVWHGRALRDDTEVQLLVDQDGNVSLNR